MADDTPDSGDLPSRRGPDPEFQHTISQWTGPEQFVAIGASVILVVNYLIADVILDEFAVATATWLISLAVLGAMYFFYAGERNPWHDFYPWMVEMGAWAIGLIGALHFLESIFDSFSSSGVTLVFQIVFYAAAGLAGAGAYQLRTQG